MSTANSEPPKTALVTGASEGIGRAFAEALATEGYRVTLVARHADKLRAVCDHLPGGGHQILAADLAEPAGLARVADAVRGGGFRLLVNNAGVGTSGSFAQTDLERLQAMTRLNCDAVVVLSHAFLQSAQRGDALINVASVLGVTGMPQTAALYAATKALVISLSENLWYEQRAAGVHVMALCPGATDTGFHVHAGGDPGSRPPQSVMQPPGEVVAEALRALQGRGGPVVVTGFRNGVLNVASRLLSHRAKISLMGRLMRRGPEPGDPA